MRAAALLCLALLGSPVSAAGNGVLFHAGFEGTADAVSVGDGTAQAHEAAPRFRPGKRGLALLSGEGAGYVSYAAERNLLADRGSIEFWVCPLDWEGADGKFHVFFEASGPGWLLIYKFHDPGIGLFLTSERHESWSTVAHGFQQFKRGEWHHLAAAWSPREICYYLDGKPSTRLPRPPIPQGLSGRFLVGDRAWHITRDARSLVDELYIYDRPLEAKEVAWAYEHAADRAAGQDVPEEVRTPLRVIVRPRPSEAEIHLELELAGRAARDAVGGMAWLEPSAGTSPARVSMTAEPKGSAVIRYSDLPAGEYDIKVALHDARGQETALTSKRLTSLGPPSWRGNKIGTSDVPPPPWTPLRVTGRSGEAATTSTAEAMDPPITLSCWGRQYHLLRIGLPDGIISQGGTCWRRRLTCGSPSTVSRLRGRPRRCRCWNALRREPSSPALQTASWEPCNGCAQPSSTVCCAMI